MWQAIIKDCFLWFINVSEAWIRDTGDKYFLQHGGGGGGGYASLAPGKQWQTLSMWLEKAS